MLKIRIVLLVSSSGRVYQLSYGLKLLNNCGKGQSVDSGLSETIAQVSPFKHLKQLDDSNFIKLLFCSISSQKPIEETTCKIES